MQITAIGFVLIPLGLALSFLRSPMPLLLLLVFFVPFSATAVVNFTSPPFGLQPGYYLGLLLMLRLTWNLLHGSRLELGHAQTSVMVPLLLLLVAGLVSIALIPLYSRDIFVSRPSGLLEQLAVTRENLTQFLYLAYVVLLTVTIGTVRLQPDDLQRVLRVFLASSLFVAVWGWMQLGFDLLHVSYPSTVFNNSISYSQLFEQRLPLLGIKRMTSVAPEPSMLARFLLVPEALAVHSFLLGGTPMLGRRAAGLISVFLGVTLLLTTSSTAIVGLTALAGVYLAYAIHRRSRGQPVQNLAGTLIVLLAVPLGLLLLSAVGLGLDVGQLRLALDTLVFGKLESVSGQGRVSGALDALHLFFTHPLLGVGWGSNRSFDFITNVLSNVGLVGLLLLSWAYGAAVIQALRMAGKRRTASEMQSAALQEGLALALIVLLLGKVLAEPGLTYLDLMLIPGLITASFAWPLPTVDVT